MTCEEYLSRLATTDTDELDAHDLRTHITVCAYCRQATTTVMERERQLVAAFESLQSNVPATVTNQAVVATTLRHRVDLFYKAAIATIVLVSIAWLFTTRLFPSRGGRAGAAVPPEVEGVIFVRCLSAEQAVALAKPYLDTDDVIFYAGKLPRAVLTIRSSEGQLNRVKAAVDRYERGEGTACQAEPPLPASR